MFHTYLKYVATVGVLALLPSPCVAEVSSRTVAFTGDQAPGMEAGVEYRNVVSPVINQSGKIAFRVRLEGPGITDENNGMLLLEQDGSLSVIARTGNPAPGTASGVVYSVCDNPALSDDERIGFLGEVTGPTINDSNNMGIWVGRYDSVNLIAQTGQQAPGSDPGVVYQELWHFILNGQGNTTLRSGVGLAGSNSLKVGIYSDVSGTMTEVVNRYTPVPGSNPEITFGVLGTPSTNDVGQIAFNALNRGGIWLADGGDLNPVALIGQTAPGLDDEAVFTYGSSAFSNPSINNSGQIVFIGHYTAPDPSTPPGAGVWAGTPDSLSLIARTGMQAPGMDKGVVFSSFSSKPIQNASGQIVFHGSLAGPGIDYHSSSSSIWFWDGSRLRLIVREGTTAPGAIRHRKFDTFFTDAITLNSRGEVAFIASTDGRAQGIWFTDQAGTLHPLAVADNYFDINDDPLMEDIRIIDSVFLTTGYQRDNGKPSGLNDAGQIVFSLGFRYGGQGIFVATIPEPGTLGVLVVGVGLILGKR